MKTYRRFSFPIRIQGLSILPMFLLSMIGQNLYAQYDGYTLYAPQNGTKAYLIDNTGATYKTWTFSSSKTTCYSSYLLSDHSIIRSVNHSGNSFSGGPVSGEVQITDWNGNSTWDFVYSTTSYCSHHDIHPMPNGNVLLICYERKTATEATAAGCSQSIEIWAEKIVEVQPSGTSGGTVVWEWHVWDHLCQNYNSAKNNYVSSIVQHPELININYNTSKDWMHANGIDYNATLNQIVFSSHNLNEVYVIDHSTTTAQAATHAGGNSGKGGDILYRWGNPAAYSASGTTNFNVVHDAHWVPYDNPSYPNSLCAFNNKGGTGSKSCVDIFTPPYNGYNYTITPGSAYSPTTYNWRATYSGTATQDMGSSQQLPNGNTLICIAQSGYLYEINSSQTTVWSKSIGSVIPKSYKYPPCYVTGTYTATATATPSSICTGASAQLNVTATGGVVYGYSWSSNPAGFTSTLQSPTVTPTVTTVYSVTIKNGPCSATGTVTLTVNSLPAATAGSNRAICSGQSTQIGASAVSGSTYSWTSSPSGFTSALANPVVSRTVTTTYTVTETVTATGCSKTNAVTVTVNPLPSANAGSSQTICAGNSVQIGSTAVTGNSYNWTSLPAGFSSSAANPVVSPTVTTTYILIETVAATGCSNSHSVTISVNPAPVAITGSNQSICPGNSVQLGASAVSGNSYSWSSNPSGFTSTLANPTVSPSISTVYTLVETIVSTGCSNSNSVTVTVNPVPAAVAGSNRTICLGTYTQLGATPVSGSVYSWTSLPSGFYSSLANPVVSPSTQTIYTLTEIDQNTGCYHSNSVTVGINPSPAAYAGVSTSICSGSSIQLGTTPLAGHTYSWTSDPPGFTSTVSNPIVTPSEVTLYTLVETITATGCSNGNSVEIATDPLPGAAGVVSGSAEVQQGQTGVTYSVGAIGKATGYSWTLPVGALITFGDNTNTITVSFTASAVSGEITVHGTNSCGAGPSSPVFYVEVAPAIPTQVVIPATTVVNGETPCFNATGTISAGGEGNSFLVEIGGHVTMIAGQSIVFLPSASVVSGGYLWAYITLNSVYCTNPASPVAANSHDISDVPVIQTNETLNIYPNPAAGEFFLETTLPKEKTMIEVYNTSGSVLLRKSIEHLKKMGFRTEQWKSGLYFLKLTDANGIVTIKKVCINK